MISYRNLGGLLLDNELINKIHSGWHRYLCTYDQFCIFWFLKRCLSAVMIPKLNICVKINTAQPSG